MKRVSNFYQLLTEAIGRYPLDVAERSRLDESLQVPPATAIRIRPGVSWESLPFETLPVAWHDRGRQVQPSVRPARYLNYAAGQYYIQDPSSLLAVALLHAAPGELICDLCAAPGGKSTAILEELAGAGFLLANEPIRSRTSVLEFMLARHGSSNFMVTSLDPDRLANLVQRTFDAVLVDAPCSGQSLVMRNKQSWSAFSPAQIAHSAARQARILDSAAELVRPGGRIVYSTCTFSDEENEHQVESFIERHPRFALEPSVRLEPYESRLLRRTYRLWPHLHPGGGAFAACLRCQEGLPGDRSAAESPSNLNEERAVNARVESWPIPLGEWGNVSASTIEVEGPRCFAWSSLVPGTLSALPHTGPEVAYRAGMTWFPSFALALRRDDRWQAKHICDLETQLAQRYMTGSEIPCSVAGWCVVTWNNQPLGWIKGNGTRGKNHLPKQARLDC